MAGSQIVDAAVQAERPPAGEHRLHRLTLQQTGELGANVGFHQGVQHTARALRVGAGAGADGGGGRNTTFIGDLRHFVMQGVAQLAMRRASAEDSCASGRVGRESAACTPPQP